MARPLKIAWRRAEEEPYDLYRREKDVDLSRRWQASWMLRRGERLIRVKAVVGVIHRTIQRWVWWYEAGGIEEVARHKSGSMKTHRQAWTAEQEAKLKEAVSEGRFRTVGEAVRWCAEVPGIEVSEGKVYYWFRRWGYRKKVPRPLAERADVQAPEAWEGWLWEALRQQEVKQGNVGLFVDEMRAGLHGQGRQVWGRRGERVRHWLELRYEWAHLVLGVDPIRKRLMWGWLERVRGVDLAEVLRGWKGQGVVVWDHAAFHRSRAVGEVDVSAAVFI